MEQKPAAVKAKDVKVRDKRGKFVSLINSRVTRVLASMKNVGKLSNRSLYEYSDRDITKLENVFLSEVESVILRFKGRPHLADSFDITKIEELKK